ncbi:MAG: hypothetical protein Q9228_000046 [Teloschistes exilis]
MVFSSSYTERLPKKSGRNDAKRVNMTKPSDCERRRRMFLYKIQQKREDQKWDFRSEQMLREDFLAFERLRTEQQDRSAPSSAVCLDDDDWNESTVDARFHGQSFNFTRGFNLDLVNAADGMIEEVLAQENAEIEALVSMFEDQQTNKDARPGQSVGYGDEGESEKYDVLFMELLSGSSSDNFARHHAMHTLTGHEEQVDTKDAMDTTSG